MNQNKTKYIARRLLALLLAGLLAFSVCGCSVSSEPAPDEKPETQTLPEIAEEAPQNKTENTEEETMPDPAKTAEDLLQAAKAYALAMPTFPAMAPYPDESLYYKGDGSFDSDGFNKAYNAWEETRRTQKSQANVYSGKLNAYLKKTAAAFLQGKEADKNAVCSPLNIWMALAMAAETAGGATRDKLLDLLGMSSIEECREVAGALWNANYCDDGACTSRMAASLWLNKDVSFREHTLKTLADRYFAGGFSGDMADPAYSAAFKAWLNDATGGLLKDAVDGLNDFNPDDVMTLATAVYFKAAWRNKFSESNTSEETFRGTAGEQQANFLHRSGSDTYYWSDRFGAMSLNFEDGGSMWLLLPDEGVTPSDLLESGEAMDFLLESWEKRNENSKFLIVDLAVPKFDAAAEMDLKEVLCGLGLAELFKPGADFSNLTDLDGVCIGSATHDARVKIDEEGCEAAAFTVIAYCGSAMPPEERMEFKLDRPFIFAITGTDGLPLFCGVINQL